VTGAVHYSSGLKTTKLASEDDLKLGFETNGDLRGPPRIGFALVCAVLTIALAACTRVAGGSSSGSAATAPGSTLTVASVWEPDTLDPLLIAGSQATATVDLLFSFLLTTDNSGTPVPEVASVVPTQSNGGISRDGRTIRYHLRRDVRWSDGRPLTAHDVVFSFQAIMNPKNAVGSREGYDQVAKIEAPDSYTVVVRLKRPYAPILLTLFAPNQNYAILPAHLLEKLPSIDHADFNARPVGSGPYRFERWDHGDKVVLARNPYYFGKRPAIEHVVVKFIPIEQTILAQLRTGEIDGTLSVGSAIERAAPELRAYRIFRTPGPLTTMIQFNTEDRVFADARVRRAFAMALDLQKIVRNATYGFRTATNPSRGLFGWTYDRDVYYPPYDPLGAAALLEAAGWHLQKDGTRAKGGKVLEVQLSFPNGGVAPRLATQIQAAEKVVELSVTLRPGSVTELYATKGPLSSGKFQAFLGGIVTGMDPETTWFLSCAQRAPNGLNSMRYCSKAVDAAEDAGASTYDRAARRRAYASVQRLVAADLPFLPLYQNVEVDVMTMRVHGFVPSSEGMLFQGVQNWSF